MIKLNFFNSFKIISRGSRLDLFLKYFCRVYSRNDIFFFHANRSGGNSLKHAFLKIEKENSKISIIRFPHTVKPKNVNFLSKNRYILNLRDPIKRFKSIFYSRKKLIGDHESYLEEKFYQHYSDINHLCENIFDEHRAVEGLSNKEILYKINGFRDPLNSWFTIDFIKKKKPFFIFHFDTLQKDFDNFCTKIKYDRIIKLDDMYKIHKVGLDYSKLPELSEKSNSNLKIFLEKDYKIYNYLIKNKDKINLNL